MMRLAPLLFAYNWLVGHGHLELHVKNSTACSNPDVPFLSYHIHVLFWSSSNKSIASALRFQGDFMTEFGLWNKANCTRDSEDPLPRADMCAWTEIGWEPEGPFLTAQYSFFVPVAMYEKAVAWTVRHRGDLDVLVHPNSGCENEDHTIWAVWLGNKWELDIHYPHSNGDAPGFHCESPGCAYSRRRVSTSSVGKRDRHFDANVRSFPADLV